MENVDGDGRCADDDVVPWDRRVLAVMPLGVDVTQLRENLKRTPTERLERMLELVAFIEATGGIARVRAAKGR